MRKGKGFKRAAAFGLASMMAAGVLSGCGAKVKVSATTANDKKEEGSQTEASKAEGNGFTDYSKGFPENVTIKIPVYDRGFEGWDPANNY